LESIADVSQDLSLSSDNDVNIIEKSNSKSNIDNSKSDVENVSDSVIAIADGDLKYDESSINKGCLLKNNEDYGDYVNLGSSSEEVIGGSNSIELRDKDTGGSDVINVAVGSNVTIEANMPYDYYYLQLSEDSSFSSKSNIGTYYTGNTTWHDLTTYTFENEGTYYLRLYNTYDRYDKYSNVLTYVVAPPKSVTDLMIYEKSNEDENKLVFKDSDSITLNITNILSSSDLEDSELANLLNNNVVTYYVNGVSQGTTAVGIMGDEKTNSINLNGVGRYIINYVFDGGDDLESSKSNNLIVYLGMDADEYETYLILLDSVLTPDSNGVYYVPIMTSTTTYADIYNDTLGDNIVNYMYLAENGTVLEKARFYYDGYNVAEIEITPNGNRTLVNAGQFLQFIEAEYLDLYLVYTGNDLGLLSSMSNHLKYVVYTDTNITLNLTPAASTYSSYGLGSTILISPKVCYTFANSSSKQYENHSVEDGLVEIYVDGEKVATVNAGQTYEYVANESGTHTVTAKYLGYDIDVDGSSYRLYNLSESSSYSITVSDTSRTISLLGNGSTDLTIKPGESVNFTSTFDSAVSGYLNFYINGKYFDYKYVSSNTSSMSITFNEEDIGDNEIYVVYSSNSASNIVNVHVTYPEKTTSTTVEVTPKETTSGDTISIIPLVSCEGNDVDGGQVSYLC